MIKLTPKNELPAAVLIKDLAALDNYPQAFLRHGVLEKEGVLNEETMRWVYLLIEDDQGHCDEGKIEALCLGDGQVEIFDEEVLVFPVVMEATIRHRHNVTVG